MLGRILKTACGWAAGTAAYPPNVHSFLSVSNFLGIVQMLDRHRVVAFHKLELEAAARKLPLTPGWSDVHDRFLAEDNNFELRSLVLLKQRVTLVVLRHG